MRKALYFEKGIGPYKAGEWYDNVPDADHDFALANGLALDVDRAECGCMLADGRAVRVVCEAHRANALRDPLLDLDVELQAALRDKAARLKQQPSLQAIVEGGG
jgi:hypothetical protein